MKSSESIKNLCDSLVKAQKKIENLYPEAQGYGYTYVPLNKIIDMLKNVLPEFGLSYIQLPFGGASGQTVGLTTRIIHESGEWLEETAEFPVTDMKGVNATQKAGAAITYFRRYALLSAFGVTGDKDVDANDKAFDNKGDDSEELVQQTMELETYIGDGMLEGEFLKKAQFHIKNKNLEGIKKTNEYCRKLKKTA